MKRSADTTGLEPYVNCCITHGLKITPQRTAIYRAVSESTDHPCADVVYDRVLHYYPAISFDTVNRTLLTFADIGLIDIVESTSGVRRYDPHTGHHHHLHCVKCGMIVDFCNPDFDALPIPASATEHFTILGKRVIFSGICDVCSVAQRTEECAMES